MNWVGLKCHDEIGEFSELNFHIPAVLDGLMSGMFLKAFQRLHTALFP